MELTNKHFASFHNLNRAAKVRHSIIIMAWLHKRHYLLPKIRQEQDRVVFVNTATLIVPIPLHYPYATVEILAGLQFL